MRSTVLILALLLVACAGGRGHPVRTSLPRLEPGEWPVPPPEGLPEPGAAEPAVALEQLFLGEAELLRVLLASRVATPPRAREPVVRTLPKMEKATAQRYAKGGPAGPVRQVSAFLITGWVPLPPAEIATLIMDPEVERQVLAANTVRQLALRHRHPGHERRAFWIEMLGVGQGPFRYDLRFGLHLERVALGDGAIAIRYDPMVKPKPKIVTMYRGGALLEPHESGTRVTELLVCGNSLAVPPPVWNALRPLVDTTFKNRAINLWKRAWMGR